MQITKKVWDMSSNKRCFVIMPFSKTSEEHTEEYWTKHFNTYLKPLIEENTNLEARRSEALRGDILRQIITDLVTSPVVVADLTDENPNVYWELGIRQSFRHGTITIAKEGTKRQFDLSIKGILYYYPNDHLKDAEFRRMFKKAISDCLEHPENPDSHVLETLTGRGTIYQIIQQDESIRRIEALLNECKYNYAVLGKIFATVEENKKEPSKRTFVTQRLSSSATELLLTNRYLDKDSSFYDVIYGCFMSVSAINDVLRVWTSNRVDTEKWLLEGKDGFLEQFKEHQKVLEDVQNELLKKRF
jgi:hypothetical protein